MDSFDSARVKTERAEQHIADIKVEVHSFFTEKPYAIRTKRDPQTRRLVYYVGEVKPTPPHFAPIIGDAIQNLRSALDHIVFQLWTANGFRPTGRTGFPICESAAKYTTEKIRKVEGIREEARKAIDAVQPYQGANAVLWNIHALNNIDKHRALITVGSAHRSIDLGHHGFKMLRDYVANTNPQMIQTWPGLMPSAFFKVADRLFPLKTGDELFTDAPDSEPDEDLKFGFDVAFGEPGIAEGEPVIDTLDQMFHAVNSIVADFERFLI